MRPPKMNNKEYEKVTDGEMLSGVIEQMQYDNEHKFRGFQGAEDTTQAAVRFKFKLNDYAHPHYSRWMKLSMHEKSNLFKKYVSKLVENATEGMDFDLDELNDMKVKTVWSTNKDFQNIDAIYPEGGKITVKLFDDTDMEEVEDLGHTPDEELPPEMQGDMS